MEARLIDAINQLLKIYPPQFTSTGNCPALNDSTNAFRSGVGVSENKHLASMPNCRNVCVKACTWATLTQNTSVDFLVARTN